MIKRLLPATLLVACLSALSACSGSTIDPEHWSCDALVKPVISMSKERTPTILEINNPKEIGRTYGTNATLSCTADAEWSEGYGYFEYGAHVSDGGQVILEYSNPKWR